MYTAIHTHNSSKEEAVVSGESVSPAVASVITRSPLDSARFVAERMSRQSGHKTPLATRCKICGDVWFPAASSVSLLIARHERVCPGPRTIYRGVR